MDSSSNFNSLPEALQPVLNEISQAVDPRPSKKPKLDESGQSPMGHVPSLSPDQLVISSPSPKPASSLFPPNVLSRIISFTQRHLSLRLASKSWNDALIRHHTLNFCKQCKCDCSASPDTCLSTFHARRARIPFVKNWKLQLISQELDDSDIPAPTVPAAVAAAIPQAEGAAAPSSSSSSSSLTSTKSQKDQAAAKKPKSGLKLMISPDYEYESMDDILSFNKWCTKFAQALNASLEIDLSSGVSYSSGYSGHEFSKLLSHSSFQRVTSLTVDTEGSDDPVDWDFGRAFAEARIRKLQSLMLVQFHFGESTSLDDIVKNPKMSSLSSLTLQGCQHDDSDLMSMLASPTMKSLTELVIEPVEACKRLSNDFLSCFQTPHPAVYVRYTSVTTNLQSLTLSGISELTKEGVEHLASPNATILSNLKYLKISNCFSIGNKAFCALVSSSTPSPALAKLETLEFTESRLNAEGIAAIIASKTLPCLKALNLSHNKLDDACMVLLASVAPSSSHLSKLESLELVDNSITNEGAVQLMASVVSKFPCLHQLDLQNNNLDIDAMNKIVTEKFRDFRAPPNCRTYLGNDPKIETFYCRNDGEDTENEGDDDDDDDGSDEYDSYDDSDDSDDYGYGRRIRCAYY